MNDTAASFRDIGEAIRTVIASDESRFEVALVELRSFVFEKWAPSGVLADEWNPSIDLAQECFRSWLSEAVNDSDNRTSIDSATLRRWEIDKVKKSLLEWSRNLSDVINAKPFDPLAEFDAIADDSSDESVGIKRKDIFSNYRNLDSLERITDEEFKQLRKRYSINPISHGIYDRSAMLKALRAAGFVRKPKREA
jgi:hypothetical protein